MSGEILTERRKQILRIVIQEYVQTAQPVSSTSIAGYAELGVSPATIRNDLAALEREGLLTHPHTSAGRIPTDAGYRYYVHHLVADAELPSAERRMIRVRFGRARQELDQWLRMSTSVLAQASQSAALATAPRSAESRYKHMEMVAIHGSKVLMVIVLQTGIVKQQLLDLEQPLDQNELSQISNELNDALIGVTTQAIPKKTLALTPFAKQIAALVGEVMQSVDARAGRQIYRDGLVQVLEAPEFAAGNNVRKIVQVLRGACAARPIGRRSRQHDLPGWRHPCPDRRRGALQRVGGCQPGAESLRCS
ncbi:MAG: heat-inducible transcription repressor HrcA [Caldilineaceae bacterium]|nr:heat-inducible transcription repressor HrcA [Caldilineaceae bacterium]